MIIYDGNINNNTNNNMNNVNNNMNDNINSNDMNDMRERTSIKRRMDDTSSSVYISYIHGYIYTYYIFYTYRIF